MTKEEARRAVFEEQTITPEQLMASGLLPVSRNSIYGALNSDEIENVRIGKRFIIPTAPLRRKFGLTER
jgi:hypothetical protein